MKETVYSVDRAWQWVDVGTSVALPLIPIWKMYSCCPTSAAILAIVASAISWFIGKAAIVNAHELVLSEFGVHFAPLARRLKADVVTYDVIEDVWVSRAMGWSIAIKLKKGALQESLRFLEKGNGQIIGAQILIPTRYLKGDPEDIAERILWFTHNK